MQRERPMNRFFPFAHLASRVTGPDKFTITPMSYEAAKAMADKVSLELSDLSNPVICPICFCDFAEDVSGKYAQHLPGLRVECHLLWDTCVATMTLHRTPEETERLRSHLAANHRRCTVREAGHALRPANSPAYLHALLESASHIVKCALHLGARNAASRAARATKPFADKHGRWPARVAQLFPRGARDAVQALLAYCELYVSAGPLDVLSGMLVVARPVVFPLLVEDDSRARLVAIVNTMLDPDASGISEHAPWLARDGAAMERAVCFLSHIISGPGAVPLDEAQFVAGHEAALLAAVEPVVQRLSQSHHLFGWLAAWCTDMARRASVSAPSHLARWNAAVEVHRRQFYPATYAQVVRDVVLQSLARRVCAGPGCGLAVLQDADGKSFPVCARCRVPRYCSRECQRRDWKGEGEGSEEQPLIAHRQSCAVLAKIEAHKIPKLSIKEFEQAFARAGQTFDPIDVVTLDTFVNSTGRHFGNRFSVEQIMEFPGVKGARERMQEQPEPDEAEVRMRMEQLQSFLDRQRGSDGASD